MSDLSTSGLGRLPGMRRKAVNLAQGDLVGIEPLCPGQNLPLAVRPNVDGLDLAIWAESHRELIESELRRCGGLLFRGFGLRTTT